MQLLDLIGVLPASFGMAVLLTLTHRIHGRWTGDFQDSGPQKHHAGNPSRVGLLPLLAGCGAALLWQASAHAGQLGQTGQLLVLLLICSAPAALLGLLEDVTRQVRARWRLLGPTVGAGLGVALLGTVIPSVGVPGLDGLLAWWHVALALTLLMVVGFTHAMNIVDGLNGLASGLAVVMLAATAYAAHRVGDTVLFEISAVIALAVLGFMLVNFPRGLIFLGDGGAYFLGFVLAQLWILLLVRNPGAISPWFVMAIAFHPTMETTFSIVRRKLRNRRRNATAPDRLHLHTLVYRRRWQILPGQRAWAAPWAANSAAALYVLFWASLPILAACLAPAQGLWNATVFLLAAALFLTQFYALVRFRRLGRVRSAVGAPTRRQSGAQFGTVSPLDGR